MKVFVTGGAGYIGSATVQRFLSNDIVDEAVVLDNEYRGDIEQLNQWAEEAGVSDRLDVINEDLLDVKSYQERLDEIDAVIHLAAVVGENNCEKNPDEAIDTNIKGTIRLLDAAEAQDVSKMVFASSQVVYGTPESLPLREDFSREPEGIYAHTKSAGEEILSHIRPNSSVKTASLRLASVYGLGACFRWDSVTGIFARRAAEGRDIQVFGDGEQRADFVHVRDVASAISRLILSEDEEVWNEAYNVGTGESTSINKLADYFISIADELTGADIEKIYPKPERDEVPERRLDISKIQERTGWSPRVPLEEGLRELVKKRIG